MPARLPENQILGKARMQISPRKPRLSFNRCNLPAWALADVEFQKHPRALHIGRVREDNKRLFALLAGEPGAVRRGEIFHDYLSVQFALHQWPNYEKNSRRSLRNSYVRYLRGWAMDANSIEGAVLKGWVASRFGLAPTFHHQPLGAEGATERYEMDRMQGSSHTNGIEGQLDLLFEFAQEELRRRAPDQAWLTLFRGTNDASAYPCQPGEIPGEFIVTLNNLNSFTSDRECAWEFGSTVWEMRVPRAKVVFFSDLLPASILKGEEEYLVLGGDYVARKLLW
jgi:NAD+--dinitrogen-reductase ADP-D-ribosyltransferase